MKALSRAQLKQLAQRRSLRWIAGIGLGYLALCFLVVVPLLNWGIGTQYQKQTGRELKSGFTRFNPFTFSITANGLEDHNADGSLLWSAQQIHLNLSLLQSLLRLQPVLDEVAIDGVKLHPHLLANGSWNFSDIIQHQATLASKTPVTEPQKKDSANSELPALAINKIRITITELQFTDSSQKQAFTTRLDNILFELLDFSTLADKGQPYRFSAIAPNEGEVSLNGNLSVKAAQSQGELAIKNINLLPVWQYFKNDLNFTLEAAKLDGKSQIDVQWKDNVSWSIKQTELSLAGTKLRSGKKEARNAELSFTKLQLKNISASNRNQLLAINNVQLDGLKLSSWNLGSDTGLTRAFAIKNAAQENDSSSPWGFVINSLAINNAAIDWKAGELNNHPFKVRQLTVTANKIDSRSTTPAPLKASATIDETATLSVDGNFNMKSLDGDFSSSLQAFPIETLKPLAAPYLKADIFSGQMATNAEWQVRNAELVQIISQGTVTDLKIGPLADAQEILTGSSLTWSDAQINITEQDIDVPLLEASGLDSRFVITTEGKTNFESLIPITVATPDAAQTTPAAEEKTWSFALHKFILEKSSFRFHDESLIPNFVAVVQNFGGTLSELSSDNSKPAQFKFNGDVDGYAPVSLQGKTQPFLTQPQLDAQLNFENIDLGNFSGYSSTYAGWKIERGLLSANLHYRLNKGLIVGDNHIEMDQLQLGDRVENANTMDVPLRLALALITDANGVATLDVNVSGNPNDPNFDMGKIVRAAFSNTLNKIIKSPFKLLANLVGSKEDLGYLPFNSGSPRLLATATRKLNALHEAMIKRPELRIELRGFYDQNTDYRGIQVEHIKPILLESGLSNADIKAKNKQWQDVVDEHYKKLDIEHDRNATADEKYERWLQTITVTQEDVVNLAGARSLNAKQFLVQHLKLDSGRVLINSNIDCTQAEMCSRRIVKLELSDSNQTLIGP